LWVSAAIPTNTRVEIMSRARGRAAYIRFFMALPRV
jgi:hypothetical protein